MMNLLKEKKNTRRIREVLGTIFNPIGDLARLISDLLSILSSKI
jgi:hypothetical protein